MDKTTLSILKEKAQKGTRLQNRIEELKKLRDAIPNSEISVNVNYKNNVGITEYDCIKQHTNDELLEPIKESLTDIIDNQIKMYEIEFEEL